jgi:FkbM family methyltransferase
MSRQDAEEAIRARVQTVYLGNKRIMTRILGRQKLFLSTDDLGFAGHVMMDGYWEIWLTQFFARTVRSGMTVIDVGANAGYYTLLFGDAVGANGRVIAVEPMPATAELLTRSIALNGHAGKTRVAQVALGKVTDATAHLFAPKDEPKNATIVAAPIEGSITVPLTTLDALAGDLDRIDLVKIDAEGAEEDIISGMAGIIERHRPNMLLEFNAARYQDPASFLKTLRRQFRTLHQLDFNSKLHSITDDELLSANFGEDWLLYLEGHRS